MSKKAAQAKVKPIIDIKTRKIALQHSLKKLFNLLQQKDIFLLYRLKQLFLMIFISISNFLSSVLLFGRTGITISFIFSFSLVIVVFVLSRLSLEVVVICILFIFH